MTDIFLIEKLKKMDFRKELCICGIKLMPLLPYLDVQESVF